MAAECISLRAICQLVAACAVTDNDHVYAGVNAVLRACTKLEALHLMHCTGPFSDALTEGVDAARAHAWFKDLRIAGSAARMTAAGVMRLLGRSVSKAVHMWPIPFVDRVAACL